MNYNDKYKISLPWKNWDAESAERDDETGFYKESKIPQGPLSRFPRKKDLKTAVALYLLFFIINLLIAKYSNKSLFTMTNTGLFENLELWRPFTSLIVHGDVFHLFSNGFLFILFGWMLQSYFGPIVFPVFSFFIGMITNTLTILFYEPHIQLLGASGMIHGMVALWIIFYIKYDIDRALMMRVLRSFGFVLVMLVPSIFDPQTSYLSHGIGFGVGLAFGYFVSPYVQIKGEEHSIEEKNIWYGNH